MDLEKLFQRRKSYNCVFHVAYLEREEDSTFQQVFIEPRETVRRVDEHTEEWMMNQQVGQIANPLSIISHWLPPPNEISSLTSAVCNTYWGGIRVLIWDFKGDMIIGFVE